jgi:hypothetical protein
MAVDIKNLKKGNIVYHLIIKKGYIMEYKSYEYTGEIRVSNGIDYYEFQLCNALNKTWFTDFTLIGECFESRFEMDNYFQEMKALFKKEENPIENNLLHEILENTDKYEESLELYDNRESKMFGKILDFIGGDYGRLVKKEKVKNE